jgi:hypothetical protein
MQITDEVTAEGKAKMLILNCRNQGNQSDSEAFYEYRWKKETFKLMKRIYFR